MVWVSKNDHAYNKRMAASLEDELTKLKGENTLLRHALDRAKRINASGVLPSVAELHEKGHVADSWIEGESYGFDRCREGVTLLIDEVLASCADAPE
jgi:hypothetical protein